MDKIQMELFEQLTGLHEIPAGAYNIRANSKKDSRNTTANIDIVTKEDKDGIDIYVKPGTKNESVHIPVEYIMAVIKSHVMMEYTRSILEKMPE